MLTPLKPELAESTDLTHEARRFRTILKSFERNLDLLFRDTAIAPHVDHAALATAFSNWRQRFDATKHLADTDRRDFTIYSAGLMLKELVAAAKAKWKTDRRNAAMITALERVSVSYKERGIFP